ncbi:MAG: hypothetical protein IH621_09030 [Krumholzibacteria bacterium]|nr:hypothetical protein [Candidatus Krumholzibacteria bacterium]
MRDALALVLTCRADATSDFLCSRLEREQIRFVRLDTDEVVGHVGLELSAGGQFLYVGEERYASGDIDTVILRRPKPVAVGNAGDEFQQAHASDEWAEAFEGYLASIPEAKWINHPSRNFAASHKVHQLVEARRCGLDVPAWVVTTNPMTARKWIREWRGQAIVKPLSGGYIQRAEPAEDSLIYTSPIDPTREELIDRIVACPVLFQQRVRKRADVRLIYLDRTAVAAGLHALDEDGEQRLDIRRDEMRDVEYSPMSIPSDVYAGVVCLMDSYGLRFGALDFAVGDSGRWHFLEINPNGQWAWLDEEGVCDVGKLFAAAAKPGA